MTTAEATRAMLLVGMATGFACTSSAQAALYKCTGTDGKVAYQDAPCPTGASEQALQGKAPAPAPAAQKPAAKGSAAPRPPYESAIIGKDPKTASAKAPTEQVDRKTAKDAAAATQRQRARSDDATPPAPASK